MLQCNRCYDYHHWFNPFIHCRTPNIYKDCAQYYIMSGLPLREIVDRAWKSGLPVTKGLIYFLDQRLLGSNETVAVSEVGLKTSKFCCFVAFALFLNDRYLYTL